MPRRPLLQLAALLSACIVAQRATAADALAERLGQALAEEGLTGAAWVLVDGDRTTLGAIGDQDAKRETPFSESTRFHVGSVTKSLLATGVLHLASADELALDAPVSDYLPELPIDNPWAAEAPVTVRHLLDHTAGLDDARLWQMFSERARPNAPLAEAFPRRSLLRVRARPGSRFSYSNMGYTVLGMVVEAVCGERYETCLDRRILAPLGMRNSTFGFTGQQGPGADPSLAWGHVDGGIRYAARPLFLRPAGQFTTTAADLGRYLRFLLGDGPDAGSNGEASLVDPAWREQRARPLTTDAARAGLAAGYALGMGRRDRHGALAHCHGGNTVGFRAMLCVFPGQAKGFAYGINTDSETADYARIERLMFEALAPAPARQPATRSVADLSDWRGSYVLSPNRFAMFRYLDLMFGAVALRPSDGELVMSGVQQAPRRLRPLGGGLLSAEDRTSASHVLIMADGGGRFISDGFRTYERVSRAGRALHWGSLAWGLAGIVVVLLTGVFSVFRRGRSAWRMPVAPAFGSLLLLAVPVPLFFNQSFMALGDPTPASITLAVVTGALPLGALWSLLRLRTASPGAARNVVTLAVLGLVQFACVLAWYELLPLRLWA